MNAFSEEAFKALLPGLLQGDPEIEEKFFHLAHGYLLAATHGFPQIKNSDREDFALEVIEKALSKLDRYCPSKGGFRTWMFVMARHLAFDKGRRLRDGHDVLHGALNEEAFEWAGSTHPELHDEAVANKNLAITRVHEVLAKLEPKDRQLVLDLVSGRSATEVGQELGLLPNTVRKRNSRLKDRIRQELNQPQP